MNPTITIIQGDAIEKLRGLAEGSVHCCVTSPPYWGLRDYGVAGQLGLERTPDEYVGKMVEVFREVRRVLREDGTCWVNLGDSYSGSGEGGGGNRKGNEHGQHDEMKGKRGSSGLKPKDLCGIPWRVAFALQADGWVLRQEIIWGKPNPMPESVQDRCTKSHEQIFLFAKAKWSGPEPGRFSHISDEDARWLALLIDAEGCIVVKRNRHANRADTFAPQTSIGNTSEALMKEVTRIVGHGNILERPGKNCRMEYKVETKGWQSTCECGEAETEPCTVLDPFGGSGTTGMVALELGRKAVLIELNPAYVKLAEHRTNVTPGLQLA